MVSLRLLGYWASERDDRWPDVADFVDDSWDDEERAEVGAYVSGGTIARAFMGLSPCRVCGAHNGSLEFTDGIYIWPQGLAHYIEQHGVRPPEEFVRHAITRLRQMEDATVDSAWWLSTSRSA